MKENFRYYAFISYSHKDKDIAHKLQKRLEEYHLPSALRKANPNLPKKLSPIFIDESNLVATGTLKEALQKNLESSNYLIVICSPNSAKSEYVNDEVEYFIKNGRTGHIIPLIVDGVPHSDDECFPRAILDLPRDMELLGIDFKKFGERDSFLRVIATMLGLEIENFINNEKRRRHRKIMISSFIGLILAVLSGWLIWYNIPHEYYYQTYVYRWEKPVGLFEIKSETERMKREYTYRFTVLRDKVQKIERVNSLGILTDPTLSTAFSELPMICFVSDRVTEYYDIYGHKVFRKEYTNTMQIVNFLSGDGDLPYALPENINDYYGTSGYNPENSIDQDSKSIIRQTLEYDDNGYVIKRTFRCDIRGGKDKKGTPIQDKKGRWGLSYEVDELGRVIRIHYLDKDGKIMSVYGICSDKIEYGNSAFPIKISNVNESDDLVQYPKGSAFRTMDYDEHSNIIKLSCFDSNGKRVMTEPDNTSEARYSHDPHNGFLNSISYYDSELEPCLCKSGYHRVELERNLEGRIIERSYYDSKGNRIMCSAGYSSIRYYYNREGRLALTKYMDINGKPAIDFNDNVHAYRYAYEDGFKKQTDYLDTENNITLNKNGYASVIYTYDKQENKVTALTFKGTDGKNIMCTFGFAEVHFEYDIDGNRYSEEYYDEFGRRTTSAIGGTAKIIHLWKGGNLISEKWLDMNDNLMMNGIGYAMIEHEYDDNGLEVWKKYYDAEGKRTMISAGYSAVKYDRDERGRATRINYYDTEDKYTIRSNKSFCYASEVEYDDDGNIKHFRFLKGENSPYQDMLDRQVKDIYYEYDKHGNKIKEYWLNGKGESVDEDGDPYGPVRIENEYDNHGRLIKELRYYHDTNEASIIYEHEYNSFGDLIKTKFIIDINGNKEFITEKKEYDYYGRCERTYYLDSNDKLIIPNEHFGFLTMDYAIEDIDHDIFGNEIDIWYYDDNEEPMYWKDHAFHTVKTYDFRGHVLSESYYDDEGYDEPTELSEGFHKIEYKYDNLGRETERLLYGTDGKLLPNTDCRRVKTYHGNSGHIASIETYDSNGNAFVDPEFGALRVTYDYDSHGNMSDIRHFDSEGRPCMQLDEDGEASTSGHHTKITCNVMGKPVSFEYFDVDDKPYPQDGGVHKIEYVYNSYGLCSEELYYDKENELIARNIIKYNSDGKKIGEEMIKTDSRTKNAGNQ